MKVMTSTRDDHSGLSLPERNVMVDFACLDPKCTQCGRFWDHRLGLDCGVRECELCESRFGEPEPEDDGW
jgi:hypothetical protein